MVYIGSTDNKIYALRAATGTIVWTDNTGGFVNSSPVVADGTLYVGTDNNAVIAVPAVTGP